MRLSIVEVPGFWRGGGFVVMAAEFAGLAVGQRLGGDGLLAWAERTGHRPAADQRRGRLRFAFLGRVSKEDYQEPVTSRARQVGQAEALVAGHGQIVAHFFDSGLSRTLAWARRPQAAALVAQLADPDRGWDAVVIGEYKRAFYGARSLSVLTDGRFEMGVGTGRPGIEDELRDLGLAVVTPSG